MMTDAQFFDSAEAYNLEMNAVKAFVAVANIKSYPQLCFVLDLLTEKNLIEYLRSKDWKPLAKKYLGAKDDSLVEIRLSNAYEAFTKISLNTKPIDHGRF
jgi:hypothetical protein